MHATGVTKKIEIQSWVPSEKNKCKQRNVGSREKRQFSLGGNGMLHLPNGIRKIFKLHYWTKTSMKYKKKWSRSLSGTALSVWGWNLRGESGYFQIWVRFLTRPFYSIFTQMISAKFSVGNWSKPLHLNLAKDLSTLLYRWGKGKNQLIINHEFIKEAKTTSARFEKLNFRV